MNCEQSTYFPIDYEYIYNPDISNFQWSDFRYINTPPRLQKEPSLCKIFSNQIDYDSESNLYQQGDHQSNSMMKYPQKMMENQNKSLQFETYPYLDDNLIGLTNKIIRDISHIDTESLPYSDTDTLYTSDVTRGSPMGFSKSIDARDGQTNEEEILFLTSKCSNSKKIRKDAVCSKELKKLSSGNKLQKSKISLSFRGNIKVKDKKKIELNEQIDCHNIVKNYGKAMAAFAVSQEVIPYLEPLLQRYCIRYEDFSDFINIQKEDINCIGNFRNVLLIHEEDSQETGVFKTIFKEICLVFLKYFAVNWIYNGKMLRKREHLNCRFHIMRRVANPSKFTYLK